MQLEGRWPENIQEMVDKTVPVKHHILYPYFELSIENLKEKGYIVPLNEQENKLLDQKGYIEREYFLST